MAHSFTRGGDEEGDVVVFEHVIGEADPGGALLTGQIPRGDLLVPVGIEQGQPVAICLGGEETPHGAGGEGAIPGLVLDVFDDLSQLLELGIPFGFELSHGALEAEVFAVEHLRVEQLPDLVEVEGGGVAIEVRRGRGDEVSADVGRWFSWGRQGPLGRLFGGLEILFDRRAHLGFKFTTFLSVGQPVDEVEGMHGVTPIGAKPFVSGGDPAVGEAAGESGAADEQRGSHVGGFEVTGGQDHLLGAFDEKARKADDVGTVLEGRLYESFVGHPDAEVDDLETVVGEHDGYEVLADVVHVALDGGEQDLAARRSTALRITRLGLHEGLEVGDGRFHDLGALQYLGDDQLVVVEEAADLGHSGHQGPVDDVEGQRASVRPRALR